VTTEVKLPDIGDLEYQYTHEIAQASARQSCIDVEKMISPLSCYNCIIRQQLNDLEGWTSEKNDFNLWMDSCPESEPLPIADVSPCAWNCITELMFSLLHHMK
jgi:hypothetical protein